MPARVLTVAFDACEMDLALPWAERGFLPTIGALLGDAASVETRSAPGLFAGAVWPSIMTGLSPARHRRYYRRQQRLGEYADRDFRPGDMVGEPFWETLSRAGRRVAIIDVPLSRLSARLNGVQIVDWTGHDPYSAAASEPVGALRELDRRFGTQAPDDCEDADRTPAGVAAFVHALQSRIAVKVDGACSLLAREDWDLFVTVFGESHCVGHQLFHLHAREHALHDPALSTAIGDPLLTVYRSLDAALGRLVADAGPHATVCVLLSHGMGPAYYDENVVIDDVLRRIEASRGNADRSWYARLRRQWYRIPAGVRNAPMLRSVRARFLPSLHRSLLFPERATRRVFAVPNNAVAGAIRINVEGRDADGRVRPEDYDAVCDEVRREFLALVDPASGEPWVRDVVRPRDRHPGPFADELPDIAVEWNRSRPLAAVRSARLGVVRPPPVTGRTGDHVNHGAFLVRGPGIRQGRRVEPAQTEDIAPTLARLVGVALEDVDGEPIRACLPA